MAKILVTPVASSNVNPFVITSETVVYNPENKCFYVNGESFPVEIVTVLED